MDAPIMEANLHARSNSLPSKSHPGVADLEDQLGRLRASEETSSSPSSLCQNLAALKEIYECADNLLRLRTSQKAFSNERRHDKCVEDMLVGSIMLLDICCSSKDALSQIKGCVQDLESSLRGRICCESGLANEIRKYFTSRKQANKIVCNCFASMKRMQKSNTTILDNDNDFEPLVRMLKKLKHLSLTVFKSFLSFLYSSKSKPTGWSLVSKLSQSKSVSFEIEGKEDKIDDALEPLIKN